MSQLMIEMDVLYWRVLEHDRIVQITGLVGDYEISVVLSLDDPRVQVLLKTHPFVPECLDPERN